ncbi:MCE family protein [Saccharopolyspora sp. HNM0983]|uniref:MCE family protein n=1 Tax=Saccharopolyspora montiporae TaxID=2781240 RepID=A0A929BCE8_9PSEU|nr:MCE family protein [Saccharopolyspora sp. HNM0983]MBE9375461.1 MCE family protein [Saccharopolyspora sp. HNM0983]
MRKRTTMLLAAGCAVVLLATAGLWWLFTDQGTRITAYFDRAVGVYAGSSVRVLGVESGRIERVVPDGDAVRVDLRVDEGVDVPADAKAVVVAPSLVSDRYVQLTPAYDTGPRMESGTVLGGDRTATPAELDELYRSANALSKALGPEGANREGALNEVLKTSSAALEGNGKNMNETVGRLADLADTLHGNQDDLFATVDNLNEFTATLAASDQQIREFNGRVSDVTGFLGDEQEQIGTSLEQLSVALDEVSGFVKDNRELLSSNVRNLTGVSQALVDQRESLGELLDVAPLGATNFINSYDAASGSVAVRGHFNELTHPPALMLCKLLQHSVPEPIPEGLRPICDKVAPFIDGTLDLPSLGESLHHLQQGELPPLPMVRPQHLLEQEQQEQEGGR